jgi:hypothetical protein
LGGGIVVFRINAELHNLEEVILVALRVMGLNFDNFKPGGLHEKYAIATWNFGTV